MKRLYCILAAFLVTVVASAQISSGGRPMAFSPDYGSNKSVLKSSSASMTDGFFQKLDVDTVFHPSESGSKVFVSANVCKVDITPENSGTTFTSNGYRVWRTGITSPGAAAINLVFTEFNIPEGANLYLYNPSQSIVIGSFSSVNNNSNNILPVQPLSADTLIVEYQEPETASEYGFNGRLKIGYAGHNFFDLNGYLKRTNPGGGITCCKQAYLAEPENPVINSSCIIYVTYPDESVSGYGSGSLINNPDGKPYVISANHVYQNKCAQTSVFFFQNHRVMENVNGSAELSIAGATSVAAAEDLDLGLAELNQMPPKDYRPFFAGWDANENAGRNAPYKCIHHPKGDFAKISYATQQATMSKVDFQVWKYPYKSFWKIARWSDGATQGGSSGSPLLNAEGKIVGCLTGGDSDCSYPENDYFWALCAAWDLHTEPQMQLKHWLDPHNSGIKSMEGADPYATDSPCYRISNFDTDDIIGYQSLSGGATGYQAGHNSLGCTAYAEKYQFDEDSEVYGLYVGSYIGRYNINHELYVKVYAGGDTPGGELASAYFKPLDYSYNYDGDCKASVNSNWKSRDTYIKFASPVKVQKECYVGISIDYYNAPIDTFALYQTTNRALGNTAYYYKNGTWSAFTSYPSQPQAASLWLHPVVATVKSSGISEVTADAVTHFDVVSSNDNTLRLFKLGDSEDEVMYRIHDINGRLVSKGVADFSDGSAVVPFRASKGAYLISIQGTTASETHKFLWR